MEVNSLRSWLRDYNRAFVLKHQRSYKRTIHMGSWHPVLSSSTQCFTSSQLCWLFRLRLSEAKNSLINSIL